MHFLSLQMEPILHEGCPHNCQDFLSWVPFNIVIHIFSFLDPGECYRGFQESECVKNLKVLFFFARFL